MPIRFTTPRSPKVGVSLKADWGDELMRSIDSLKPVQVPGMLMGRSTYGVSYTQPESASIAMPSAVAVAPFAVRWYRTDESDDTKGEWQIYLPRGCATVEQGGIAQAYVPVNAAAQKRPNANTLSVYGWYALPVPQDTDATVATDSGYSAKQWTVNVLMKPWPRMKATTKAEDANFGRAQWSFAVASIYEAKILNTDGSVRAVRSVSRLISSAVENHWDTSKPWAIRYEVDGDAVDADVTASLINQYKIIGRLTKENIEPQSIKGWTSVWVKYIHPQDAFTLSVADDLSGADAVSDDAQTVFKIYDMDGDVVKTDYRDSIPAMDFYTNKPDMPEQE